MTPVLTAAAMQEADRATIEDYGLPSFVLMETAGRGVVRGLLRRFGKVRGRTAVVACGKGHNGGDGLVIARRLYEEGARVCVALTAEPDALEGDPAHHLQLLRTLQEHDDEDRLKLVALPGEAQTGRLPRPDLLVDALLGIGLTSEVREPIRSLVAWMNEQDAPTFAVDVPTGLHADTGAVLGEAVRAAATFTMAAPKRGLLLGEGPDVAGEVEPVAIGIPPHLMRDAVQQDGCAQVATADDVAAWLPRRERTAHKYSAGMVLAVAGSAGLTGAPVMASQAAARAGAGAVVCACGEEVQPTLASHFTSVMTLALPTHDDGGLDPDASLDALAHRRDQASALLVGPGLGRADATGTFVRRLLDGGDLPAAVDADGLFALAGHTDLLERQRPGRLVLTPHAGEFKRLAGDDADLDDPVGTAQRHAQRWGCVLVLKGTPTVVAGPGGATFIDDQHTPALATAGTGDVLAGTLAGLLAQGMAPARAAATAVYLGGATAQRYVRAGRAAASLQAPDLVRGLPRTLALLHASP